jgi:carbonic anhydrase
VQFIPYAATVICIVFTDLLTGVVIGLAVSVGFILHSNFRQPLRRVVERHLGGDVLHIELANQVSFLNRAVLAHTLSDVPRGCHVLLDARSTDFIDPDVLSLLREFKEHAAPARGIQVSLLGFREKYQFEDQIQYIDYSDREVQGRLTPDDVVQILKEGNERFRTGHRLKRDLGRQVDATANGQFPLAVVLSCIDSRTPIELIFDLGLGDIFSIRIAGNITSKKVLGSMEYGCAVAGAKLILVMGHTRCGAVTAAVNFACSANTASHATGCQHLDQVVNDIQRSIDLRKCQMVSELSESERRAYVDSVARQNVITTIETILNESRTLNQLVQDKTVAIVGGMYDVASGQFEFL